MAWQHFKTEVPDGMRLGSATDSEGGVRGLLFDARTNRLVTHALFFRIHDGDSEVRPRRERPRPPLEHGPVDDIWKRAAPNLSSRLEDLVRPHLERGTVAAADWVRAKLTSTGTLGEDEADSNVVRERRRRNRDSKRAHYDRQTRTTAVRRDR